jgi:hypothetical protein
MVQRFAVPASVRPLLVLAVGKLADPSALSAEIAERDRGERTRLPLSEVAFAGTWGEPFDPSNR